MTGGEGTEQALQDQERRGACALAHCVLGVRKDIHELIQQTSPKTCSRPAMILDTGDLVLSSEDGGGV